MENGEWRRRHLSPAHSPTSWRRGSKTPGFFVPFVCFCESCECHPLRRPARSEFFGIGLEEVDARAGGWRSVVPVHETRGVVAAPTGAPAFPEPFGMRIADGRVADLQFGQLF